MPPSSLDLAAVPGADRPLGLALQLCTMVVGTRYALHCTQLYMLYPGVAATTQELTGMIVQTGVWSFQMRAERAPKPAAGADFLGLFFYTLHKKS